MRYVVFGLIGLIALVVGAAAVGPAFVDWSRYKHDISAQVHRATGRTLLFDGGLDLSILPSPRFSADGLRIVGQPGSGLPDMARVKGLQVHLRLLPLLRGEIEVASMTLVEPEIVFAVARDGRTNWANPSTGHPEPAAPARGSGRGQAAVRLDRLRITGGTAIYRAAASGTERRIQGITADFSAQSLSGPFEARGEMISGGVPMGFEARIGSMSNAGSAVAELTLSLQGESGGGGEIKGRVERGDGTPSFVGTVAARAADFERLVTALAGGAVEGGLIGVWKKQPFELGGRAKLSATDVTLDDLAVSLGGSHATGAVSATFGETVHADVALKVRQLDLDRILRAAPPSAPAGRSGSARARGGGDGFVIPETVGGSIDLTVESATLLKRRIRDVRLTASLSAGEMTVRRAAARLPGGASLSLSGFVAAKGGEPRVDGRVSAKGPDLRAALGWLGVDIADIAGDRLRKFEGAAKVKAVGRRLQVSGLDLRLDGSRVKGAVTYILQARPSFGANLSIDRVNLDAYLSAPPGREFGNDARDAGGKKAGRAPAKRPPLAVLEDFDANLVLGVDRLTYRQTAIQGIRIDGSLVRGKMTVKTAAVRDLGGTRASLSGSLSGFGGFPTFDGRYSAEAANIASLIRILGIDPAGNPGRLGGIKLAGSARTTDKRIAFDSDLDVAGGKMSVKGTVDDYRAAPRVDLEIGASHPDYRRLGALFGADLPTAKGVARRVALSGTVKGPPDTLAIDTRLEVAGVDARLTGKVARPIDAQGVDLRVTASHPELVRLAKLLAPDYRPSATKMGPARLAVRATGTPAKFALADLVIGLGPARLTGTAAIDASGARPSVVASLTGGDIVLDPLLPADPDVKNGARAGRSKTPKPTPPGERFSRERLDLSAFGAIDGELTFQAASLTREKVRIGKPRLHAVLKDRVLAIRRADGSVFGGTFDLAGTLNGAAMPALDGRLSVRNAKLDKALFEAGDIDLASGTLDLDLALKGAGRSERDIVARLTGKGSVNARDGVIKGFDLRAVSDRLGKLRRATDFLGLLGAGMGGGATPFSRLTGTFKVRNGVLASDDIKLVADGGEGTANGTVDLPRWTIDMSSRFHLTEHAKAPPFGMRLRGQLDAPRRFFQYQDLQAFLLRRSVDRLLKDVLPGAVQSRPPGPAPAASTPPRPAPEKPKSNKLKAEDILRGLLPLLERDTKSP